jgi:hypothetical protein
LAGQAKRVIGLAIGLDSEVYLWYGARSALDGHRVTDLRHPDRFAQPLSSAGITGVRAVTCDLAVAYWWWYRVH